MLCWGMQIYSGWVDWPICVFCFLGFGVTTVGDMFDTMMTDFSGVLECLGYSNIHDWSRPNYPNGKKVTITHQLSISRVDRAGVVHTNPLITSLTHETFPSISPIRGASTSAIAPRNHAY